MFKYALIFTFSTLLFSACTKSTLDVDDGEKSYFMPTSNQTYGEVLVVLDTAYWGGDLGDAVRQVMLSPMPGLPQDEPPYRLTRIDYGNFSTNFKRMNNILIVHALDSRGRGAQKFRALLGEENIKKMEAKKGVYFRVSKDLFAKDQQVIFLVAPTKAELITALAARGQTILNVYDEVELKRVQNRIFGSGEQTKLSADLYKKHGFQLRIPREYQVARNDDKLVWLRAPLDESDFNIIISSKPYVSKEQMAYENINAWREELSTTYIFGSDDTLSYKVTETILPPEYRTFTGDEYRVEARGLWKLQNNTMGGAFVSETVLDKSGENIYYIEGFLYAPNKRKRELVRQLTATIRTLEI